MNRNEFEEKLNEFGWHITPSHNGLNHRIESNDGVLTDLRVREDRIEPFSNALYGGASFVITCCWYLDKAYVLEDNSAIAINHLLIMNLKQKPFTNE